MGGIFFDIVCIESYETLANDLSLSGKTSAMFVTIPKGTIYSVQNFYGDYKIKGENSFIMTEQYEAYYMTLKEYRESKINSIID